MRICNKFIALLCKSLVRHASEFLPTESIFGTPVEEPVTIDAPIIRYLLGTVALRQYSYHTFGRSDWRSAEDEISVKYMLCLYRE